MAQHVVVVALVDDIDGSETEETVHFGLDGVDYQIDLSEENAAELRDSLAQFMEHARRVGGRKADGGQDGGSSRDGTGAGFDGSRAEPGHREWARKNGFSVSDRGRISSKIAEAYNKKH
ncbi:histone-like nucleoid-structuring protein Lsr2 [Amycolatopsis sp. lyj-108]|uniref:histone-like nucleoid-structuring protein Lsr2 n=1 Tax=Amycolatopsis sp. lyj-108 TaxID=2789286 RepID=UPI003979BB87